MVEADCLDSVTSTDDGVCRITTLSEWQKSPSPHRLSAPSDAQ